VFEEKKIYHDKDETGIFFGWLVSMALFAR
jgi:hypothetical protein